jgi:hypothetical protein
MRSMLRMLVEVVVRRQIMLDSRVVVGEQIVVEVLFLVGMICFV